MLKAALEGVQSFFLQIIAVLIERRNLVLMLKYYEIESGRQEVVGDGFSMD
jgi:hypothetical protein